jgi:hypothetical protein
LPYGVLIQEWIRSLGNVQLRHTSAYRDSFLDWLRDNISRTSEEVEEEKDERKRADIVWSSGSEYFSVMRMDVRKVGDLWIIHYTGDKRPQLESYKYGMPGEEDVAQYHLQVGSVVSDSVWAVDD